MEYNESCKVIGIEILETKYSISCVDFDRRKSHRMEMNAEPYREREAMPSTASTLENNRAV